MQRRFSTATSGLREQARLREEAFRLLVESVKDYALYMLDAGGHIITWNAGAQRIKGYAEDEILGAHFSTFYEDADVRARTPERELEIALREGRCEDEGWRVRKDGSRFWANTVITPVYDDHEALLGFATVSRDMTERRQADEQAKLAAIEQARSGALEDSAQKLEFLAEASQVLSSTLDSGAIGHRASGLLVPRLADWCTIHVAPDRDGAVAELLAVAHAEEAKAAWVRELYRLPPPDAEAPLGPSRVVQSGVPELYPEVTDAQLEIAAGGDPGRLEILLELGISSAAIVPLRARGRSFGAMTVVSTRPDRRYSRQDMALLQEFADRASMAMENARLYEAARRAIRQRDEFLSIASHELRTPLTALQLQVQRLAKLDFGGGAGDEAKRIEAVQRQVRRMSKLATSLLDVSLISSGRLAMEVETFDLGALVDDVAERFREVALESRTELRVRAPSGIVGEWDRGRVDQIVSNLLSNALKFGEGKPVELEVSASGDTARVVVRDHGIGVAKVDQERIFDQFERAVPANNFAGLGLGLWVCRELAWAMGGRIELESEPGRGARFTVTLPRACFAALGA